MPSNPKRVGRPRKRGVKTGSHGATIGGAKSSVQSATSKYQKSQVIIPNGVRLKLARDQFKHVRKQTVALRKGRRRALKQREKRAIKTSQVVSPRHSANLEQPTKPFGILQMEGDYLSTAIYQFDYDPLTLTLKIQFWRVRVKNKQVVQRSPGSIYIFFQVPSSVHEELLRASSKGRYFYYHIRGKYTFQRLS